MNYMIYIFVSFNPNFKFWTQKYYPISVTSLVFSNLVVDVKFMQIGLKRVLKDLHGKGND